MIITSICLLFVAIGIFLPIVNEAVGNADSTLNDANFDDEIDTDDLTVASAWNIFLSVLSMFFWTFGALPFWLDAIFMILRVTLVMTIARNIWIGGGG